MKKIIFSDRLIVGGVSFLFIVVTIVPYMYGWALQNDEWRYTWAHRLSVMDFFVYDTYINQLAEGVALPRNMYTHEPTKGIVQLVWMLPAVFVKLFDVSAGLALQIFRILLIPLGVAVLYALVKLTQRERHGQIPALFFFILSSGVGYIIPIMNGVIREFRVGGYVWPMDLWVGESNTFLTLLRTPHILLSLILLASTFLFGIQYLLSGSRRRRAVACLSAFVLMWIHPFYVVTIVAVLGAYAVYSFILRFSDAGRALWLWFACSLATAPGVAYYAWLYFTDAGFQAKASQNLLYTPPLTFTLLSYGGLAVFALLAVILFWRSENIAIRFCVVWAVVGSALLYAPLTFQRRLTEGLHIPLAILSFQIIFPFVLKRLGIVGTRVAMIFIIGIFSLSNINVYFVDLLLLSKRTYYLYLPQAEVGAAEWIRANTQREDVILAPWQQSSWLPSITHRPVYAGHWVETLASATKSSAVDAWYRLQNETNREQLFRDADVVWVNTNELRDALARFGFPLLYEKDGVWLFSTTRLPRNE